MGFDKGNWTWIDVTKIIATFIGPMTIALVGGIIQCSISDRAHMESQQSAVQELSTFIYDRRSRAALLLSALQRHSKEPVKQSREIVMHRKELYDESFHKWNSHIQANLLLLNQLLEEDDVEYFEEMVQGELVLTILKPLDKCLTDAYDDAIRGRHTYRALNDCEVPDLLRRVTARSLLKQALSCGKLITDKLFEFTKGKSIGSQGHKKCEARKNMIALRTHSSKCCLHSLQ